MLGRRTPQMNFFDAASLPHRVTPESFYGRMGAVAETLFQDDDLKQLYDPNSGRPSLPPSLLAGVVLLQFYDDVSDGEAVERTLYDLRWKVALHLPFAVGRGFGQTGGVSQFLAGLAGHSPPARLVRKSLQQLAGKARLDLLGDGLTQQRQQRLARRQEGSDEIFSRGQVEGTRQARQGGAWIAACCVEHGRAQGKRRQQDCGVGKLLGQRGYSFQQRERSLGRALRSQDAHQQHMTDQPGPQPAGRLAIQVAGREALRRQQGGCSCAVTLP